MKYLFVIVLLFSGFQSRASHIVGGEIYYDYLPGDNYQFFISMYRDCNSTGAQFDNPLNLAVYTATGVLVQNVTIPFPGSQNVPVVFNNPCVIPPNNICTENALYTTILNLPPIQGGYTITYQRCCRGPNITNIINPDDVGFTLTCKIPGAETGAHVNSSPRYVNYPPQLLCNNEDLNFDHSATDPDGDIMTYSLITPHDGGTSFNPQPVPAPPPAYGYVQWANGFSAANPLGPGATISINSNTGQLLASPNLTGLFVVGIRVQEWRNGQVINQTDRDFLFRVFNCNLQLEAILPLQTELPTFVSYCDGLDVDFVNNSYGGTNYEWDFGVPGITTDVSSAFEPSYTYPDNGQYTAMLVVNPGWPCTDTAYMDVIVNNQIDVSWTSNDSLCIFGNSFDFVGSSNGPPGTSFTWDFGSAANPSNAVGDVVNGVNFNTTGQISVTLDVEFNSCENSYTDSIYIFPEPIADMILPDDVGCEGLFIDFVNNSQNSNYYEWNFGDTGSPQNTSNDPSPSYTYPGPGTYTVTLVAGSSPVCNDTITQTITLNEPLIVSFISQDSL